MANGLLKTEKTILVVSVGEILSHFKSLSDVKPI